MKKFLACAGARWKAEAGQSMSSRTALFWGAGEERKGLWYLDWAVFGPKISMSLDIVCLFSIYNDFCLFF